MTSDYLNIKSLFYDDESILEGMKALRDRDKKLYSRAQQRLFGAVT